MEIKPIAKTKPFSKEDTKKFVDYIMKNKLTDEDKKHLLKMADMILRKCES